MKSWDAIIVGGGVIGLSLARRLKSQGLDVLIVDKHEPAREATYAAGGMIASCDSHMPQELKPFVAASAKLYPEFVQELQDESGEAVDLRDAGTIAYFGSGEVSECAGACQLTTEELSQLEPLLRLDGNTWFLPERCVDPRGLGGALIQAAKHHGVDFVTGSPVVEVLVSDGRAIGVRTSHSEYGAGIVVNCSGAWAAHPPTRDSDPSGERPDGLRCSACRSASFGAAHSARGPHARGLHHSPLGWPHSVGRNCRGSRIRQDG